MTEGAAAEPLQVLILEDRPADAELMARALARAGFAADWRRVDTLSDFLHHLTPTVGLVLADYSLPGFTAMDALDALRATGADVPFIVLTGSLGDDVAADCLKRGAADYILKDRMARLGPAIRRVLADRQARREADRTREALAASEERMRNILSTIEDVVFSFALRENRLLYLNPAAERLTGRPVQEFLDDPQKWLDTVHPDDRRRMAQAQEEAVKWGAYESEYRMVRRDGTVRDVLLRAWTAYDRDGVAVRTEGLVTDVTDKRQAERQRLQAEASRKEAERLAHLNEFKTQFIGMVAHDLNNVLTPLRIHGKMLADEWAAAGRGESKSLRVLDSAIDRLGGFLADLLDASRLQAGSLVLDVRPFDAAAGLRRILEAVQPEAEAGGLQVDVQAPPALPAVADPRRFEQVVANLVSNAVKFTPRGGTVGVGLWMAADGLHLQVADSGRGIAAGDLAKLFQPFGRLGSVPQGKHTGTGLGLFICRGIVEQHGGRITCASAGEGQGATFHAIFPPPAQGASGPPPPSPSSTPPSAPSRSRSQAAASGLGA